MKLFLLSIFAFSSFTTFSQTKIDTLKNETIIRLSKNKLSESVITQKINQSICSFDISIDALIKLKENNVNDNVINLMVSVQDEMNNARNTALKNYSKEDNFKFPESGIYFLRNDSYISLDPSIVTTTTPSGFGILYKSKIVGEEANYQLENKRPEFYFNFETVKRSINDASINGSSINQNNYLNQLFNSGGGYGYNSSAYQAVSPNDFKLIRVEKNKGKREFVSGRVTAFDGDDMSPESKSVINFKYEKVSASTYKIIFDKDLASGEYCFLYLSNNKATNKYCYEQNNMKVFDFGVK